MVSDLRSSPQPPKIVDPAESLALTVILASEGAQCVVHVSGELDIATRNILFHACLSHGPSSIVIDLAEVEFMDCGGYGGIVAASLVLQERGVSLALRNPTGQPARLLDLLSSTNLPVDPAADSPDAPLDDGGRRRLPRSDSHAPNERRYRLTDDSAATINGSTAANGSAATNGEARVRVRTAQARGPTGAARQVCTVRHQVDRR